MSYESALNELNGKAEWIEGLEGTISGSYTTDKEDVAEYFSSSNKRFVVMFGIITLVAAIALAVGLAFDIDLLTSISAGALLFFGIFTLFYVFAMLEGAKNRKYNSCEVKLSFNAYGVALRECDNLKSLVCAYHWNDFENIIEYKKIAVGIKEGVAYIFPKRAFTKKEFDLLKKYAYAVAGKKCMFKDFKPNN